jgi:hypothetical protein
LVDALAEILVELIESDTTAVRIATSFFILLFIKIPPKLQILVGLIFTSKYN